MITTNEAGVKQFILDAANPLPTKARIDLAAKRYKALIEKVFEDKETTTVKGFGKFEYFPGSDSRHPAVRFKPSRTFENKPEAIAGTSPFVDFIKDNAGTVLADSRIDRDAALFALACLHVSFTELDSVTVRNGGKFDVKIKTPRNPKTGKKMPAIYSYSHFLSKRESV